MEQDKIVSVLSMAKIHATAFGFLGLVLGVVYSFGGLLIDAGVSFGVIASTDTPGLSVGTLLAFGALLGMPAIGAAFGVLQGIVVGVLYRLGLAILTKIK